MGKIKYYISGKITGLQPSEYAARFGKAEEHLTAQGFDVVLSLYQRCSFRLVGQCESLYSVERVTEVAPRFFSMYT